MSTPPSSQQLVLQAGTRPLPEYELIRQLGVGGFGEVWQARGPGGIDVALKFIRLDVSSSALELRSLEVMKAIHHPNLSGLSGVWRTDKLLILAMELCDRTLQDRLNEALQQNLLGIPVRELLGYMRGAAEGLDALHDKQVQHRDVKPGNLLLLQKGVKVADFGLAKVLDQTAASHTGAMTVSYAAPEFFKETTSQQSDQYSLAATYVHLRTGRLLFEGSYHQVAYGHMSVPPDLSRLPTEERPILARALAKEPKERWRNCKMFVNELIKAYISRKTEPQPQGQKRRASILIAPTVLPPELPKQPKSPADKPKPDRFTNSLGIEFVLAPPATFWMGFRGSQEQVEIPHRVYMGIYPITQGQWHELMGNNPSWFSRSGDGADEVRGISDADLKLFPVEQVSWRDAQEFIEKLNAREPNREWKYRLPTDAEWEYVCRGGATSQAECAFDFYFDQRTNDASSYQANFNGNFPAGNAEKGPNLRRPTKIGSYKGNNLGVFDMLGNVWEWCDDACGKGGSKRVIRGGGWNGHGKNCQAATNYSGEPQSLNQTTGFRLARVPSEL